MKKPLIVAMLIAVPLVSFAQPPAGGGQAPAAGGQPPAGGAAGRGGAGRGGQPAAPIITSAPTQVTIIPSANFGNGSAIPAGRAIFVSAGYTGSGGADTAGTRALTSLQTQLARVGLTMKDVVQITAYLKVGPDGVVDTSQWQIAWNKFFNNAENPTNPSRASIGVAGLVGTATIEVVAVAVYPAP